MSVALIVATYLLARAEVEGLPTTSRFTAAISPENPRARVANAAQLKPFKEELAAWGLEEQVQITLELLVKAALLVRDEQGRLRPSALAYSWLQLPPATCHRLLFESSGVALPLPAKLIEALINGVALSEDSSVRYSLEVLAASGLIELEKQTLARA
ncbi:MAG: hypothetical protein HXX20_22380, partial [Chloroflexi bacterium]|nr:hypothetical protein [Chloroflexota bacterium]